MILSLETQAQLFLLTILMGGALGLIYDCLRVFRRIIPHKRFWIQLEDGIFWVAAVFFAFGVMLEASRGEIRFFSLLGMIGGMGLYFLTLSHLVIAVSDRVIFVVKKIVGLFFTILFTPFRLVYLLFRSPLEKAGRFCAQKKKKVLHSCNFYVKIKYKTMCRDWRMVRAKKRKRGVTADEEGKKSKKSKKGETKKVG